MKDLQSNPVLRVTLSSAKIRLIHKKTMHNG
nr:MAG TPA: hypothetical protein [Caudoviricetes sp.]DAS20397.1 MAG TPA: hypothetical protein [Caudoviricetes sp.]